MSEFEAVTLTDPSSSLTATVVPLAGMVVSSLADGEDEFLGQRRGLDAYITNGKTMGIPLLYPWANRLSASKYGINGAVVTLTPGTGGVRTDEHGVPIHGVLAAYPGWLVTDRSDNSVTAVLDYGGRPRLLASFPFPHVLTQQVTLADRTLTIETTRISGSQERPARTGCWRRQPCGTYRWTTGASRPGRTRNGPARQNR
jgi:galactose mutarotase-like enzyme